MSTLDSVVDERKMTGPILLKADVQGYELEALRGANQTLRKTEVILLEVSTLPYNIGAPLLAEVVAFMAERRFLVYDLVTCTAGRATIPRSRWTCCLGVQAARFDQKSRFSSP